MSAANMKPSKDYDTLLQQFHVLRALVLRLEAKIDALTQKTQDQRTAQ